jgi:hypothetical protein
MASLPWTGLSEVLVCARIKGSDIKEPWLQTQGTAMGTPAAPLYSILTFGYHKNTSILNTFKPNLLYYKHYIDDIFGIWIDNTTTPTNHNVDEPESPWVKFKETLNQFGSLKWNVEPLTHSTNYMSHQLMKHTAKELKYSVYGLRCLT